MDRTGGTAARRSPADPARRGEVRPGGPRVRGAASVEYVGLVALVALVAIAAISALVATPGEGGRELGSTLARKLRCAARLPDPCWRDPLTEAYGRALAGAVRALAPAPRPVAGPSGTAEVGVDFRRCRQPRCAVPAPGRESHLTVSNRRTVAFTAVRDRRRADGEARISYWIYRPGLPWEEVVRRASSERVAALAATPLLETADPRLVPLETLPGRNHVHFAAIEEPPWRWRVGSTAIPERGEDGVGPR